MSTIVSSFVKDRASAAQLPTASLISGAVKAWGAADASSSVPVIREVFNVSSLSDVNLGHIGYNLTAVFTGKNYAVSGTHRVPGVYSFSYCAHDVTTSNQIIMANFTSPPATWTPTASDSSYSCMHASGSLA